MAAICEGNISILIRIEHILCLMYATFVTKGSYAEGTLTVCLFLIKIRSRLNLFYQPCPPYETDFYLKKQVMKTKYLVNIIIAKMVKSQILKQFFL